MYYSGVLGRLCESGENFLLARQYSPLIRDSEQRLARRGRIKGPAQQQARQKSTFCCSNVSDEQAVCSNWHVITTWQELTEERRRQWAMNVDEVVTVQGRPGLQATGRSDGGYNCRV